MAAKNEYITLWRNLSRADADTISIGTCLYAVIHHPRAHGGSFLCTCNFSMGYSLCLGEQETSCIWAQSKKLMINKSGTIPNPSNKPTYLHCTISLNGVPVQEEEASPITQRDVCKDECQLWMSDCSTACAVPSWWGQCVGCQPAPIKLQIIPTCCWCHKEIHGFNMAWFVKMVVCKQQLGHVPKWVDGTKWCSTNQPQEVLVKSKIWGVRACESIPLYRTIPAIERSTTELYAPGTAHSRVWTSDHSNVAWRCGESNPGLSACRADALPLCHIPGYSSRRR